MSSAMPFVAAAESGSSRAHSFSIHARAEPGLMPRVLELFAKRGLVPHRWHSRIAGPNEDSLMIDIEVRGLERDRLDYVANCMRQIAGVEAVLSAETRPRR